jgi:opacity protein-like surface antigen
MVKYFCTGAALAAVLVIPVAAPAVDLSLTSIYQGRPVVAATGWALADRWTIASTIDTAAPVPAYSTANNRHAWSAGAGYILLTRWSLKGEYDYVNLLDPSVSDAPGSTTIAKAGMPLNRRTLKVGGNYDF